MANQTFLSANQQAVANFMEASKELRLVANDSNFPELAGFTDHFLASVTLFGRTEMEFQRRSRVAGLTKAGFAPETLGGLNDLRWRLATQFNLQGIELLDGTDRLVEAVTRVKLPGDRPAVGDDIAKLRKELYFHISELEVKPADAQKIIEGITPILDIASRGDVAELYREVANKARQLQELRSTEDRGMRENIPVWKVIAIVIAFGIWIWALFRCKWWGSCSLKEGLAYAIVFWISALIANYC